MLGVGDVEGVGGDRDPRVAFHVGHARIAVEGASERRGRGDRGGQHAYRLEGLGGGPETLEQPRDAGKLAAGPDAHEHPCRPIVARHAAEGSVGGDRCDDVTGLGLRAPQRQRDDRAGSGAGAPGVHAFGLAQRLAVDEAL